MDLRDIGDSGELSLIQEIGGCNVDGVPVLQRRKSATRAGFDLRRRVCFDSLSDPRPLKVFD
jgi:hypothetical protein